MILSRRSLLIGTAATLFAPHTAARGRTVLVGDSLAFMMFPHLRGTGIEVVGKGGTNLGQWLKEGWLRQALRKFSPQLLLVSLGTNDAPVRVNREAFPKRALRLVELCTVVGTDVMWLVPPSGHDSIAEAMRKSGGQWLDARGRIAMEKDGVHPTFKGFQDWSRMILDRIG